MTSSSTAAAIPTRDEAERLVRALYRGFVHRDPGDDELSNWAHALTIEDAQFRISAAAAVAAFSESAEHRGLVDELADLRQRAQASAGQQGAPLFCSPGHFYSPIVDPAEAKRHLRKVFTEELPTSLAGIDIDVPRMRAAWRDLSPYVRQCRFPRHATPGFRYHFDNPAYSYGDGITLYAMLRKHRPKRIVEIGCGWSSACMLDTIERDLDGACELTFIEPFPALLETMIGGSNVAHRILAQPVQDVDLSEFEKLEAGDILFIDSTHVLKTGSDVCFELFEVISRLTPGVLIHFHDVFWPFEYPREWVLDENRSWNEIYALRAVLQGNSKLEIMFFGNYLYNFDPNVINSDFESFQENPGGAIWLKTV